LNIGRIIAGAFLGERRAIAEAESGDRNDSNKKKWDGMGVDGMSETTVHCQ
jgi:hypothetical protein